MKKVIALTLACLLLLGALASCSGNGGDTTATSGADTTATRAPEQPTEEAPVVDPAPEPAVITVTDAKATPGMTGDFKAVFAAESGTENVVTGTAQTGVCHSVTAALPSPTVLTSVVFTAPSENQGLLAAATVEASVNGTDWTVLKTLGSVIVANKVYTLNINDTTEYLYVRIRQSEATRTEAFAVRTLVFSGIAKAGNVGNIAAAADETEKGTLLTMKDFIATGANPANVFTDNNESYTASSGSAGSPNWLIATFHKKTEIRKITVKLWDSNRRPRGTVIQASVTGAEWVDLYTIEDLRVDGVVAETGEWTYYLNDSEQYSFIRLVQREDLASYDWTLNTVLIYGVESEEAANDMPPKYVSATTQKVTLMTDGTEAHSKPEEGTAADLWDTTNTSSEYTAKEHPNLTSRVIYYISGRFEQPTVITKIVYYSPAHFANRVRTSYFEASVDGVNWVKIATLPGSSDTYANSAVITLNVDDDTAYSYIRLVQGEGFYKYYWTVGTAEVIGVTEDAQ